MTSPTTSTEARFRGCLLGAAVADAMGAPYEGLSGYDIYQNFGFARDLVRLPSAETLYYTDDTQMMIGVAKSLLRVGAIDEHDLMGRFLANFDPARGYGPGARRLLHAAIDGEDWRELRQTIMPGGWLGNGGAMRVAPVGLLFADDPGRLWAEAGRSALPTHTHPVGIEGAQLVALAVALALREGPFDRAAFWDALLARAATEEFRWQLAEAARAEAGEAATFGSSLRADRSVVTAIACFAASPDSYEDVVGRAISLGDDTDTVAAMAAAISGARVGIAGLPSHLVSRLEDAHQGRSHIDGLARRLAARAEGSH